ncbi:hypothetical protein [Robiginitomaculum antarcticum]|uniref:hypothetical protein n=1 Tax=Robiginitomaculum antarcticum TaxID=437507 RepID=UPI00036996B7|nr:hypothetical protein [Robiginitomaculum antarcticum]
MTRFFRPRLFTACALGASMIAGLSACQTLRERAVKVEQASETNPGPCPRAFSLYDAARIVEFAGEERYSNVAYSGEMGKVTSVCRYVGTAPIIANLVFNANFGIGPAATQRTHTFRYFVAVTRKNIDVIDKEYFPITVTFPPGSDRVSVTETVGEITIARANETTSGENFEIIIGFDLTEAQADFNAEGKRFRPDAGQR